MEKFKWYLKQILPLRYKSHYYAHKINPVDGKTIAEKSPVTCKWRMWFGFSFCETYHTGWIV